MNLEFMQKTIRKARGLEDSDLVLKNANIVNVFTHTIVSKDIAINDGKITGIGSYTGKEEHDLNGAYVLPGLIDAHIHIESTLASPLRVSLPLLKRGTTALMADPHEIVNAGGKAGLDYMLEEAALSPLDIYVMMPSSVPSTGFETNGAGDFMAREMEPYVKNHQVFGLGEVMRFHDVLNGDKRMLEILETFEGRPIDGHAPGVHGRDLMAYRLAGITSDHEAVNADEAIEKLEAGLHLFLREGSGAQNLEAILQGLIEKGVSLENCSFCTDDKHLEEIETRGHIDWCLKKAVDVGADPIEAVCMATIQSARHFGLKEHGAVAPGYLADLVIVKDLKDFEIIDVYKNGKPYAQIEEEFTKAMSSSENAKTEAERRKRFAPLYHSVHLPTFQADDLPVFSGDLHRIELIPGELLTRDGTMYVEDGEDPLAMPGISQLVLCERYGKTGAVQSCLVKGFGLKGGAIASSFAHDAHNVIAIGDNREDLACAINALTEMNGGYALASHGRVQAALPLEVGGLMSEAAPEEIVEKQNRLIALAQSMGIEKGVDPFTSLAFLALPVIPELRLTDKGLFDTVKQTFVSSGATYE